MVLVLWERHTVAGFHTWKFYDPSLLAQVWLALCLSCRDSGSDCISHLIKLSQESLEVQSAVPFYR